MKSLSLLAVFILFSTLVGNLNAQICQPPNAISQPTFNHLRCYGTGDTVNANPSSNSHYTYSWSTGATTSSIIITNPTDSAFSVTVTNTQLNCSAVFTDSVRNDPQIHNTNILSLVCAAASDSLQIDGSGGLGSFTLYPVEGIDTNKTGKFRNLSGGSNTFIIIDSLQCTQTGQVSNTKTAGHTFKIVTETGASNSTDFITVTPIFGGGLPFEYQLDGGTSNSSGTFNNVSSGAHTIRVTYTITGCTYNLTATVPAPGSIASPTFNPAICYGVGSDTINANPNDSSGLYLFMEYRRYYLLRRFRRGIFLGNCNQFTAELHRRFFGYHPPGQANFLFERV